MRDPPQKLKIIYVKIVYNLKCAEGDQQRRTALAFRSHRTCIFYDARQDRTRTTGHMIQVLRRPIIYNALIFITSYVFDLK